MSWQKGDIVTRISHQHDLLFRVQSVEEQLVKLYGEEYRLEADAAPDDLVKVKREELTRRKKAEKEKEDYSFRLFRQDYQLMRKKRDYEVSSGYNTEIKHFQIPPRILHIDGDPIFLKKCIHLYQRLGLQVHGVHVHEKEMPNEIQPLLKKVQPDMIVITGHDSFSKNKGDKKDLRAYRHSKYFTETVRKAREYMPHLDQLVIFAGACQSHFESLIRAGANFASSPSRINIHALDPVYIAAKIGFTSFMDHIQVWDVLRNTLTGEKGIGGVETKGLFRTGMPFSEDSEDEDIRPF
ncbi:spore coat assemly protein [Salinibacillus kushneri]|uniref:Spore coat assemly protein n=1 Tax=Salinibacillus kushneri TaxID=237682 RepID=A0A1I0JBR0_9BACI|nr:sporulation peptidase YabG [Salinibacillus kushneri]SEU06744.1 spore coat assemly protein [Salinibacillus kushneri]